MTCLSFVKTAYPCVSAASIPSKQSFDRVDRLCQLTDPSFFIDLVVTGEAIEEKMRT